MNTSGNVDVERKRKLEEEEWESELLTRLGGCSGVAMGDPECVMSTEQARGTDGNGSKTKSISMAAKIAMAYPVDNSPPESLTPPSKGVSTKMSWVQDAPATTTVPLPDQYSILTEKPKTLEDRRLIDLEGKINTVFKKYQHCEGDIILICAITWHITFIYVVI